MSSRDSDLLHVNPPGEDFHTNGAENGGVAILERVPKAKGAPQRTRTLDEVAQALGVAKSTVSRALSGGSVSEKKRAAILQKVAELGYQVDPNAQRLAKGRCSSMVGLFALNLDLGVNTAKIKAIQRTLASRGLHVPIFTYGSFEGGEGTALARALVREKPGAIVCNTFGVTPEAWDELRDFRNRGGIVVCYDGEAPEDFDRILFNFEDDAYQAARHLIETGHRKLGFFTHGDSQNDGDRWLGIRRAAEEFGVTADTEWFWKSGHTLYEEAGLFFADKFLARARSQGSYPDAVYIVNDNVAVGFLAGLTQSGWKVPQDVAIVGHDDLPLARCVFPPLTSFVHPVERIAQATADLLLERLEGRYQGPPQTVEIRGELAIRHSSGT